MSSTWETFLADRYDANFNELLELVRIPSVSTDTAHRDDMTVAADWVANRLTKAGVPHVEVVATAGHPAVVGFWHAAPGKPTVVLYGHYDVQPVDPVALWETPPFEPTIRDGLLLGRGAADMKANLVSLIQAVEAIAQETGAPPINLTFLFEGEEESESHLPALVAARKDELRGDFALSADGGMGGERLPTISISSKGITGLEIGIETSSTDLHSGKYGAAVPNAAQALVQLAVSFHGADGRVAVAGFYDDVRELSTAERARIAAYPETDAEFIVEAGVQGLWGEPGYTALERRWVRPTIDFNGIAGGFQGDGTKTVTPAKAMLKLTSRLVANQDPRKIQELIVRHIETHAPAHARVTIGQVSDGAFPYEILPDHPMLTVQREVLKTIYGVEPVFDRTGGTVPINEVFKRELGIDVITIGFGLPGSKIHAPNEQYVISQFALAQRVYAAFLLAAAEA